MRRGGGIFRSVLLEATMGLSDSIFGGGKFWLYLVALIGFFFFYLTTRPA
jgi:hypothetical protein